MRERSALIVGAGIGGLAAGIALRRAGWSIRVFERAASPRELGFGVALAPNAVAALGELGLAGRVVEQGFSPTRGEIRRADGTVLKRAEMPPGALGGPLVIALRPALHGVLLDALGPESLVLGSQVTGVGADAPRPRLHLADGTAVEGDLVVGADGIGSVVRRSLHPNEPPPRPSGIVAVRGVVHGAVPHLGRLSAVYYLDRGIESMLVRASNTGIYWYLSLAGELVPASLRDPRAIVARLAPQFDDTFRAVTAATGEMRCDDLVDRDPIPAWGRGHVTLLGDAAHPVLPHTGQGAAQAMVDAVALASGLAAGGGLEPSLRAYEAERQRKTAVLVRQGRRTAALMRSRNPVLCRLREVAVRVMPMTSIARVLVAINRRAGTDMRA